LHGSPLIKDGVLYTVAGRSSFLDGGMILYRFDPATGKELGRTILDARDPETGREPKGSVRGQWIKVGTLPDILQCDGENIFMRHVRFDLEGKEQKERVSHLYVPAGFLDDTAWARTLWFYGRYMTHGWGGHFRTINRRPSGRILVMDDDVLAGFGRIRGVIHHLFATGMKTIPEDTPYRRGDRTVFKQDRWSRTIPIAARAMVLAGKTLFAAGPPGTVGGKKPNVRALINTGQGRVMAFDMNDQGKTLGRFDLGSAPRFDGMAAANGRLYISLHDGRVVCLK
jgi:outer membrane protein assembly factor BamB